jgi:membrane associated rhomboid family serine protease
MFFPIGDVNVKRGYKPIFSYVLIALNVLVYVYMLTLSGYNQAVFVHEYGSIPAEITAGQDYHTLLTSMFLHGGHMHLIGNMLFLWVFADNIEASVGYVKFLIFYLAGGVFAALAHCFLAPGSFIPCVGASGAISACLGAYIVMFPHSKIRIFVLFLFSAFEVSALYFLGFWILQQFVAGVGSFANTADTGGGVAYWAHIGGFVFGVAAGFYFKRMQKKAQVA